MAAVSAAPSVATPPQGGTTHPYTCNTCQVAFRGSQQQRSHMQSDWHRYNLKRRVASLPPLSSEIFNEKVLANQASAAATAAKATFEKVCAACQRTYFSENAYQNHLNSQKHKARLAQLAAESTEDETSSMTSSALSLGDPVETSTAGDITPTAEDPHITTDMRQVMQGLQKATLQPTNDGHTEDLANAATPEEEAEDDEGGLAELSEADKKLALTSCLFCNVQAESLLENAKHMGNTHGMFVPERKYLVDPEGLLEYLYTRVHGLHECLFCGQIKHTTSGIQTHMRDKGHCMIAFESEEQMLEVGEFYDFTSTYSDDSDEDDEWEDDDEDDDDDDDADEELDTREAGKTPGDRAQASSTQKPNKRIPKSAEKQHVYYDEDGLHLPSGRVAGHRSLSRYFRQNLRSYASVEERQQARQLAIENGSAEESADADMSVIRPAPRGRPGAITRADGGLGMLGVSDSKKKEAKSIELADKRRAQKQQSRYQWGNEKRANNQKHFRDPLLQ